MIDEWIYHAFIAKIWEYFYTFCVSGFSVIEFVF